MLAVNTLDPAQAPLVVPTHFTLADEELLIHLARPNPVWPHAKRYGRGATNVEAVRRRGRLG